MNTHQTPSPFAGTAIDYVPPEGFDENGRHILAECREFRKVEMWSPGGPQILETAPEIDAARWSILGRLIDRQDAATSTKEQRLAWMVALSSLKEFTKRGNGFADPAYGKPQTLGLGFLMEGRGGLAVACRLAHTLGRSILAIHDSRPDKIEEAIDDCATMLKNALRANATAAGKRKDGRSVRPMPVPFYIIEEAELQFWVFHEQPNKRDIRAQLEARGIRFSGKGANGKWMDAFNQAALGGLPDSPVS